MPIQPSTAPRLRTVNASHTLMEMWTRRPSWTRRRRAERGRRPVPLYRIILLQSSYPREKSIKADSSNFPPSNAVLLQTLNHNSTRATTAIANPRAPNLALLFPKHAEKRRGYACSRCTERVSQCDGAAVEVDFVLAQVQQLHICERDDAEGFVDFEGIDFALFDAGVLERFWYREGRCGGEF